jgi:hypothetical protein
LGGNKLLRDVGESPRQVGETAGRLGPRRAELRKGKRKVAEPR